MSATLTGTQTNFSQVLNLVREAGYLKKKPSFYIIRLIAISVIASALWTGAGFLAWAATDNRWWMILAFALVALLGVMSAQYGFIAHEAAHRQIFRNNKLNDWTGLILANLFAGAGCPCYLAGGGCGGAHLAERDGYFMEQSLKPSARRPIARR